jgi:hypothetical protein
LRDDGTVLVPHNLNMSKALLILANEPRSYREIMANTLKDLRPHIEVFVLDPESLDDLAESLSPDLVIGSKLTARIKDRVRCWVDLYPDGEQLVTISIGGHRRTLVDIRLSEILCIVDVVGDPDQGA